jgi:hypothetical protein
MPKTVPNYGLIRRSDIIARMSLQKEDICSSDSSSEDPTDDKEEDLVSILGIVPNLPQKPIRQVQVEPKSSALEEQLWVPFENRHRGHWSFGNHSSYLLALESVKNKDVFEMPKPVLLKNIKTAQQGDVLAQKKKTNL